MNAALVRPGLTRWPPLAPLATYNIRRLYYDLRDPQVDQQFLDELRADPKRNLTEGVGIQYAPDWDNSPAPEVVAKTISDALVRLASPSYFVNGKPPAQCAVLLDNESKDMSYVLACITAFRKLRSSRELVWTLEGHQGEILKANQDLVAKLNSDPNITGVIPQSYDANVIDWETSAMTRDVVLAGVDPKKVFPFIGLRQRTPRPWWEGCLFVEAWEQLA